MAEGGVPDSGRLPPDIGPPQNLLVGFQAIRIDRWRWNGEKWWKLVACCCRVPRYVCRMIPDLLIDGMLSGTGVRDARKGGYLDPKALGLSASLTSDVADWQRRYEDTHFAGFPESKVTSLDEEGLSLLARVQAELPDKAVGYFSNGRMIRLT